MILRFSTGLRNKHRTQERLKEPWVPATDEPLWSCKTSLNNSESWFSYLLNERIRREL